MAGKDRKRALARQRYERQQERRAAKDARNRRIKITTSVVLAVFVVAGGGSALAAQFVGAEDSESGGEAAGASSPPQRSAKPGECLYLPLNEQLAQQLQQEQIPPQQARPMMQQIQQAAKDVGRPPAKPDKSGGYRATVATNRGEIEIDLSDDAPCTVNSFKYLASKDFFADTKCHRVVKKPIRVLQCGDPSGTGVGGPSYRFADEDLKGAKYGKGVVAMANSGKNSNGSQFFIVYKDPKEPMPAQFTPVGEVSSGLDIVEDVADGGLKKEKGQQAAQTPEGVGEPKRKIVIEDFAVTKK